MPIKIRNIKNEANDTQSWQCHQLAADCCSLHAAAWTPVAAAAHTHAPALLVCPLLTSWGADDLPQQCQACHILCHRVLGHPCCELPPHNLAQLSSGYNLMVEAVALVAHPRLATTKLVLYSPVDVWAVVGDLEVVVCWHADVGLALPLQAGDVDVCLDARVVNRQVRPVPSLLLELGADNVQQGLHLLLGC